MRARHVCHRCGGRCNPSAARRAIKAGRQPACIDCTRGVIEPVVCAQCRQAVSKATARRSRSNKRPAFCQTCAPAARGKPALPQPQEPRRERGTCTRCGARNWMDAERCRVCNVRTWQEPAVPTPPPPVERVERVTWAWTCLLCGAGAEWTRDADWRPPAVRVRCGTCGSGAIEVTVLHRASSAWKEPKAAIPEKPERRVGRKPNWLRELEARERGDVAA